MQPDDIHDRMAQDARVDGRRIEASEFGGYVDTRMALAIHDLARYAIKRKIIAAFVAPSGCGKSMALRALSLDVAGSALVTIRQTTKCPGNFLAELARNLGVSYGSFVRQTERSIIEHLRAEPALLLLDECHKAHTKTLDVIREIWDATRVPILMAATHSFIPKLKGGRIGSEAQDLHDQLFSRVSVFRDLTCLTDPRTGQPQSLFTVPDIRKVFHRGRIRLSGDATMLLARLANTPGAGGLRSCYFLVEKVADFWPDQEVTARLLHRALALQIGPQEAGFVADMYDSPVAAKVAAG